MVLVKVVLVLVSRPSGTVCRYHIATSSVMMHRIHDVTSCVHNTTTTTTECVLNSSCRYTEQACRLGGCEKSSMVQQAATA